MAQNTRVQHPEAGRQRQRGEGGRQKQGQRRPTGGGRGPGGGRGGGGGRGPGGSGPSGSWTRIGIPLGLVVVVVVGLIIAKLASGGSTPNQATTSPGKDRQAAPAVVARDLASVPATTFDAVGVPAGVAPPIKLKGPALTSGGKPEVLFMGDEWCPYCAAERWAVVTALSRFGTFKNLAITQSSATDIDPDTSTLSFAGAQYTSPYISFVGDEMQNRNHQTLVNPTSAQTKLIDTYDNVPYVSQANAGAVPFIDFGNKYMISSASYDPGILAGLTQPEIAADLTNAATPVNQAVIGTANVITGLVCKLTGNQPSSVCLSKAGKAGVAAVDKLK
jgi:hypothetical protein